MTDVHIKQNLMHPRGFYAAYCYITEREREHTKRSNKVINNIL